MNEHLTGEDIRLYHERQLTGRARLDISEHMLVCEPCRARVFEAARPFSHGLDPAGLADSDAGHLSYDDLAGYTDGELSSADRKRVAKHLHGCQVCSAEFEGLRELRDDLRGHGKQPQARPTSSRLTAGPKRWAAALALAATMVLAAGVIFALRSSRFAPADQVATEATGEQPSVPAPPAPPGRTEEIQDGGRVITLASGSVNGLDGLEDSYRAIVQRALVSRTVETAAVLRELAGKRGALLAPESAPADAEVLAPVAVVSSSQPRFRWRGPADTSYQVSVFDENYTEVAGSAPLRVQTWQPQAPLPPGRTYSWQLTVRQNDRERTVPAPPAPQANFRTMDAATAAEVERLRARWPGSSLILALVYANFGLLDDAQEQLQALQTQNPGSDLVADLAASLERARSESRGGC